MSGPILYTEGGKKERQKHNKKLMLVKQTKVTK